MNLDIYSAIQESQVFDIPENIKMFITSHQICNVECTCGKNYTGNFPEEVKANTQYGDNTKTTIAYLNTKQYKPYNRTKEFFKVFFNQTISEGTIGIL